MIFVCTGSRNYQFDRLIKKLDELIEGKIIEEQIFAQIGDGTYIPRNMQYKRFVDAEEYKNFQKQADIVITHGGTGSIVGALKSGKNVIAVPGLAKFGEHIKGQYFLFRTKDIHSKGMVSNFAFPLKDSLDIRVNVTLVRSHKRKVSIKEGFYRRYVDGNATFDYLTYGSLDTYDLSFGIVRFPISEDTYECIVTNLPEDEFPMEQIKLIYFSRWA